MILVDPEVTEHSLTVDESFADDAADTRRYGEHDVYVSGWRDEPKVHRVAAGEDESLVFFQVRFDLCDVHLRLHLIGNQHECDVASLDRVDDGHDLESVAARLFCEVVFDVADDHVQPRVAHILCLGVSLAAVTQHSDLSITDDVEVGFVFQVESISFGRAVFFDHFRYSSFVDF